METNIKKLLMFAIDAASELADMETKPKRAAAVEAACNVLTEKLLIEIFGKEEYFKALNEQCQELKMKNLKCLKALGLPARMIGAEENELDEIPMGVEEILKTLFGKDIFEDAEVHVFEVKKGGKELDA